MAATNTAPAPGMTWLIFALMTVASWGVYGIFLHLGVVAFKPGADPTARYKAFLFVGVAYFLTAVLAPLAVLMIKGASWDFLKNGPGVWYSLIAGTVGAVGAFCVLLAFGAKGHPAVVMSIIFAAAPIINAIARRWMVVDQTSVLSGHCSCRRRRLPGNALQTQSTGQA